jgi:sodium-dependent dicarboxylate transporter 2/3/5
MAEDLSVKITKKTAISFLAAIIVIALSRVLPLPDGLTREGMTAWFLIIAAIIMWVCETMPMAIVSIILVMIMPFFGIMEIGSTWSSMANSVFFFLVATFALTAAISNSTIPTRIAKAIMKICGTRVRLMIIGFTLATAVLSAFMSNVPSCALFAALSLAVMKANGDPKPGESNFGRAMMIAIPCGSVIGGFMTPAGGPNNIMAMEYLSAAGYDVSFLVWMIIAIPIGLVACFIAAGWAGIFFKPEPITEEASKAAIDSLGELGPLTRDEKVKILIIVLMIFFWIMSTWWTFLNTAQIALLGMCAMFLPGVKVLTWKEYRDNADMGIVFMIGGVNAMAAGVLSTGAASWLVNTVFGNADTWPTVLILIGASVLGCLLHLVIPSGPAVAGLAILPMIEMCQNIGYDPFTVAMIVTFWCNVTMLLPTDAVPVLTYGYGYYTMGDMLKFGIVPSIICIVFVALIMPVMCQHVVAGMLPWY